MQADRQGSTLLGVERRLRPLVVVLVAGATLLATLLLAMTLSSSPWPLWLPCALVSLVACLSNLRYRLTHTQPSIGMIPVALASLFVAALPGACAPGCPTAYRTTCIACVAVGLGLAIPFVRTLVRMASACHSREPIAHTAALIVLGGAVRQGRPCHTLSLRLDTAARLWHEAPGRLVVVTGGPTSDGTTTEAATMARYLEAKGVPTRNILLEPHARNTSENILYATRLLDDRAFAGQRCVVSSDYHLLRALRDASRLGHDLVGIPAPTPAPSIPQQWSREALTLLFSRR